MAIASDMIRGHIDTIILSNLSLGDNYGYEINKNIKITTDGKYELKEATLYSAFKRMEDAGLIFSYWGDENSGARRKYYKITSLGTLTLEQNIRDWKETKHVVEKLIGGE